MYINIVSNSILIAGWWQYDERTSLELETAYQKGERCCELLVAGFLYVADFDSMLQYRRNDTCKRRRIKRDIATTNKKGVAGLKLMKETTTPVNSNTASNVLIPTVQIQHIQSRPMEIGTHRRDIPRNRSLGRRVSDRSLRDGLRPRRHSLRPTPTPLSDVIQTDGDADSEDSLYSRNLDLDDMIHNTLDWTIQQIESLQLELSNDYDNLSQDVDRYERLQNVVSMMGRRHSDRSRLRRSRGACFSLEQVAGDRTRCG